MRLTNDGIKGDGHWMDRLVGGSTDATAVSPEEMEYTEVFPTQVLGSAAVSAEALYAEALETQFGTPALAETVELNDQIAA